MPKSDQPPRTGTATGELLPRPKHGHQSPGADPGDVEQGARRNTADIADQHPSWLKTWRRLRAELVGSRPGKAAQGPARELQDKIAHTPAHTLAGLQAQAELIAELAWNDVVAATARQLIAGLKRLQRTGVG
ncbi:MAG: hypothetical protein ACR2RA_21765 [Geminicoccaceae bacterium]